LDEVYALAQLVNDNMLTIGSSLEHVHIPGRGVPEDTIPPGQIEVGMGIHNEPGSHRDKADLVSVVSTMLSQMLDESDPDRAYVSRKSGDDFVLLINNLGGVSPLELSGILDEVHRQLVRDYKIKPVRVIQGTFLTSLNGLGFSISLLRLADTGLGAGKSMLELIDAPAEALGWSAPIPTSVWENRIDTYPKVQDSNLAESAPSNVKRKSSPNNSSQSVQTNISTVDPAVIKKVLGAGLARVIKAEPEVTRFDTIVGDGDCGVGLKRGAEAIQALLEKPLSDDAVNTVNQIVTVVENVMDGTSGAIYAIFLNALAHGLREQDTGSALPASTEVWAKALKHSVTALGKYTPAKPGDRTLMDALVPFCDTLFETHDVCVAAAAAQQGTESTKSMKASLGRSVYVGGESEWIGKVPDPGAYGLTEFLTGIAESV
jgi:dihydroxyacetone kinase